MAALHGAVALVQMDNVPMLIGQDLNLNVPRILHKLLNKHPPIAKGSPGFAAGLGKGVIELLLCSRLLKRYTQMLLALKRQQQKETSVCFAHGPQDAEQVLMCMPRL